MATFKIGQRVRIANATIFPEVIGREATIRALPGMHPLRSAADCYGVTIDGFPQHETRLNLGLWWGGAGFFSPLTDPGAEAFIASLKRLAHEPINTVPERKVAE